MLKHNDFVSREDVKAALTKWLSDPRDRRDIAKVLKAIPAADVAPVVPINGDTSDGYHTFNELYYHRAVLFSVVCSCFPERAWKSKKHFDGSMYEGMFIVGIDTPAGPATYHYDIKPYWDMFDVKELENAPQWDGHSPADAIARIGTLPAAGAASAGHGRYISKGGRKTYERTG